jgi:energy-coupling factor transporter ATP-binding protein EcfA2
MKFAENVIGIPNAFNPNPLNDEQLPRFYYDETMCVRTGDKYLSPIEDIYDACKLPSEHNAFLLLGHKGCGKSTELNHMSARLKEDGYQVFTIECGVDLDLNNPLYADLLILMGEALLKIANQIGCSLDSGIVQTVRDFWVVEEERCTTAADVATIQAEGGVSSETPSILGLLKIFLKIKADLKFNEENRNIYREKVSKRAGDWIMALKQIADKITQKLDGKQPIIIYEDLDKLNPEDAWKVFYNYAKTLTGVPIPVIYTFPIALSYDPRFAALEGFFTVKTLPMIKLENLDGSRNDSGYDTIFNIIEKRACKELFEDDVLERLTFQTGGSLRDLFFAINTSAQRAVRRKSQTIGQEDADKALEQLKTSLTRRIEQKHYSFLVDIFKGNRERIQDREVLLEMLQANTVLEYNGKRWHNVHPLVVEFLKDQGLL